MNLNIRPIAIDEIPAVIALMRDFAEFEKLSDWFKITEDKLKDVLFGDAQFVESLAAVDDEKLIGYALFFPCFASFRGQRSLYLEDLFITPEYRGHNVGELMLREIARIGKTRGFERIDFQVIDWNEHAMRFYRRLGAEPGDGVRYFKFTDEAFLDLAG
jgi:GNAT superfamily N-acetyltransferase